MGCFFFENVTYGSFINWEPVSSCLEDRLEKEGMQGDQVGCSCSCRGHGPGAPRREKHHLASHLLSLLAPANPDAPPGRNTVLHMGTFYAVPRLLRVLQLDPILFPIP